MKLILAVVNKQDTKSLVSEMMKKGFSITKLSSEGSFLKGSTCTLMCVTHLERVSEALEVIKKACKSRKYDLSRVEASVRSIVESTHEVVVGGATVFVLNVEEAYKF